MTLTLSSQRKSKLWMRFTQQLISEFGPLGPKALLLHLGAMTGLTGTPVAMRTTGESEFHSQIALSIERMLGSLKVMYVSSASEAGIVGMGTHEYIKSFILDGCTPGSATMPVIARLIQRRPIRTLDAPLGDTIRARSFDRPISVLLMQADDIDDHDLLNTLVTVDLKHSQDTLPAYLQSLTAKWLAVPDAGNAKFRRILRWQYAFDLLAWEVPCASNFLTDGLIGKVTDRTTGERVRQVIALANVVAILLSTPRDGRGSIVTSLEVVQFVNELFALADVDENKESLTPAEQATLNECVNLSRSEEATTPRYKQPDVPSKRATAGPTTTVTAKELHQRESHRNIGISAIHTRLNALEDKGLLERKGKCDGKQMHWEITARGRVYSPATVATSLKSMFSQFSSGPTPTTKTLDLTIEQLKVALNRGVWRTLDSGHPRLEPAWDGNSGTKGDNFGSAEGSHTAATPDNQS